MEIVDEKITNKKHPEFKPWGMEENQFCVLLHLSQLASYAIPLAGIALPIVMWTTYKEQSELIDKQGKNILNWIISSFIYIAACTILSFILIGIPLLILIGICSLIFTVIGAIKASDGIIYKYPLSITFIK